LLTMRPFFPVVQTKIGVATWHGGINLALCSRLLFSNKHPCGCHFWLADAKMAQVIQPNKLTQKVKGTTFGKFVGAQCCTLHGWWYCVLTWICRNVLELAI
jgi:hypothetical protein